MEVDQFITKFFCEEVFGKKCINHRNGYGFQHVKITDGIIEITKLTNCILVDHLKICGCYFEDENCDCDFMNGDGENA